MIPAKGYVKNYHWGRKGEDSLIARFIAAAPQSPSKELNGPPVKVDDKTPLAELWFGSHPSGPATLAVGDHMIKLNEFLAREPEMMGVIEHYVKYNKQLSFLFKILSVAEPLSLQAHPDKKLAEVLHKQDPKNYPDANHKPELAIALTDFHVLCDFRPHKEIVNFMRQSVSFKRLVGEKNYEIYSQQIDSSNNNNNNNKDSLRMGLRECFKSLMTCSKETIAKEYNNLKEEAALSKDLLCLMADLERLYPGDPGIFTPLFLNYLKLTPGQGIYLGPNKLHAYLKGDCIECMACSDNVVRAGLTTKYRDVHTLISMLDYEPARSAQDLILTTRETISTEARADHSVLAYKTPTDEFKVEKITITNTSDITIGSKLSGSFIVVLSGKATARDFFDLRHEHRMGIGFAGFIPPKIEPKLSNIQGTLVMYRAFC